MAVEHQARDGEGALRHPVSRARSLAPLRPQPIRVVERARRTHAGTSFPGRGARSDPKRAIFTRSGRRRKLAAISGRKPVLASAFILPSASLRVSALDPVFVLRTCDALDARNTGVTAKSRIGQSEGAWRVQPVMSLG